MEIPTNTQQQLQLIESIDDITTINLEEAEIQCVLNSPTHPDNESTLIARILSPKAININAFKNSILKAWNPIGKTTTNSLGENTLAFVFENEKDIYKIMNSTWTFRDHHICIAKWSMDKALPEVDLYKISFWVHVYGLPVSYTNLETAKSIGGILGKFLKADLESPNARWKKSLRMQVECDTKMKLQRSMVIAVNGGSKILLEIRYECLTDFCFNYQTMGKFNSNEKEMNKDKNQTSTPEKTDRNHAGEKQGDVIADDVIGAPPQWLITQAAVATVTPTWEHGSTVGNPKNPPQTAGCTPSKGWDGYCLE
ncbi:hypothetical protein CASFOL_001485 [Castilleja foliolosa]|uniref:DUF4283 domain-containing protein n=1 Tax=Castilleja foliolosa TaxID=1961234 RepID=A0ABD3EK04_9LAMI